MRCVWDGFVDMLKCACDVAVDKLLRCACDDAVDIPLRYACDAALDGGCVCDDCACSCAMDSANVAGVDVYI